jgi:hypothetical protein
MFRSPYDAFTKEDMSDKNRSKDGQGEPLEKKSRHSEDGHSDVAASATINAHHDGSYSVEDHDGELTKHDSYEEAADHAGKTVGKGDEFGTGSEKRERSEPSKLTKHAPKDDMSGACM